MNNCLFCKIISGEASSHKVHEDGQTMTFLNIFPMSKGHALIIPKTHSTDLSDSAESDALALIKTLHKIAPAMMSALGASAYNLGMNHGKDAGQEIFHTHLHVIPRYEGIPRTFQKSKPTQEELSKTANLIKNAL